MNGYQKVNDWLILTNQKDKPQGGAAIGLLLSGPARLWYESLTENDRRYPQDLLELFRVRYVVKSDDNWRERADLGKMQQKSDETVEDFITRVTVQAKRVDDKIDDEQIRVFILQGLKPGIRQHVIQHENLTIGSIGKWGKLAEQNDLHVDESNAQLAKETLSMVKELAIRLDRVQIATNSEQGNTQQNTVDNQPRQFRPRSEQRNGPVFYNRTGPRPHFNNRQPYNGHESDFNSRQPYNTQAQDFNSRQTYNGQARYFSNRQPYNRQTRTNQQTPRFPQDAQNWQQSRCQYCGRSPTHPREICPAKAEMCRACATMGHFARMCRKSQRPNFQEDLTTQNNMAGAQHTAAARPPFNPSYQQ